MSDPNSKLQVINIEDNGWSALHSAVPDHVNAKPNWKKHPLDNIVDILDAQDCTSAVVQSPYSDEDTLYDYHHDQSGAFEDAGKSCARIHFFAGAPLKQIKAGQVDFGDLARYDARHTAKARGKDRYLGNLVIRPTGKHCVGRTLISSHFDNALPEANLHVQAEYKTHISGTTLKVESMPFMQQDKSNHRCAGVALWELCYDLHRRYNTPRFFPREVTEIATNNQLHGRPIEDGLNPVEMGVMLEEVKCAVDLICYRLDAATRMPLLRDFVDTVYGYVHSNLPVLVGYWKDKKPIGHVVLTIGHDLKKAQQTPKGAFRSGSTHLLRNSDFVSQFWVQDDQRGPYQTLEIWRKGRLKKNLEFALEDADKVFLLPGLTKDALLPYLEAQKLIRRALTPGIRASLRGVRTRLSFQRDRRFWGQLLDDIAGRAPLPNVHIEAYRRLGLPRYVWVCDLVVPDNTNPRGFRACGEILLNGMLPYDSKSSVLAMRLGRKLHIPGIPVTVARDYEQHPWAPCNLDLPRK